MSDIDMEDYSHSDEGMGNAHHRSPSMTQVQPAVRAALQTEPDRLSLS